MTDDRGLLADRRRVEVVRGVEVALGGQHLVPAHVDELAGQVEVRRVPGDPVELDERHLDLGVAVGVLAPQVAEVAHHAVGHPPDHVEQFVATGRPLVRDAGLDEVAHAVQLVAGHQVVPAHLMATLHVGVEIAVGLLRPADDRGEVAGGGGERLVGFAAEVPRDAFEHLVEVGVAEPHAAVRPRITLCQSPQVVHRTVAFQPGQRVRGGHLAVLPLPPAPEAAGHGGLVQAEWGQPELALGHRPYGSGHGVRLRHRDSP